MARLRPRPHFWLLTLTLFFAFIALRTVNVLCSPISSALTSFKECLATTTGTNLSASYFEYDADLESRYAFHNYQWQTHPHNFRPAAYFLPHSAADVVAAVRCGKPHAVPLVPKGGGHHYEKLSFTETLFGPRNTVVLDLQEMDSVDVSEVDGTVNVGVGALLGQLAWPLYNNYNLVTPHGSCPTVGIAGLALGGGYGYLSRMFGLTTDQILELELVDASGELLNVSADSHPELFWGLRGAGSGSFGVVTNFKLRAHPAPANVVFGSVRYPLSQFQSVFAAWQRFLLMNPPKEIQSKLGIGFGSVNVEIHEVQMEAGQGDAGRARLAAYLADFPTPDSVTFDEVDYSGLMMKTMQAAEYGVNHPSEFPSLTRHSHGARPFKAKSFTVEQPADEEQITELARQLDALPTGLPWWHMTLIDFYQWGGAINDPIASETSSFPHRNQTLFLVQAYYQRVPTAEAETEVAGSTKAEEETEQSLAWLRQFYSVATQVLWSSGSYSNYADVDLPDFLQRYYGSNLARLIQLKRTVDSDNYFRHPQSIPLQLPD